MKFNIKYEDVVKAHGAKAAEVAQRIESVGQFGAGALSTSGGIDLLGLTDAQLERVNKMMEPTVDPNAEPPKSEIEVKAERMKALRGEAAEVEPAEAPKTKKGDK